jgi:hypothetical protein
MKMEKKEASNREYPYAKKDEDIKDGDLVKFLDPGEVVTGQYGDQKVFAVETPQGKYSVNLNQTSENSLVEFLGDDSEQWVGKECKAMLNTENVSGTMRRVLYFVHPDGDLLNPVPKASGAQTPEKPASAPPKQPPYPEEDINPDDIPW